MSIIPVILRADTPAQRRPLRARDLLPIIILGGMIHGGVMGSFGGMRPWQMLYSAVKLPMLLGISFSLTLPSFFILNTLLGLREDFRQTIRAVARAQAGLTVTLVSLSPFVALWYASCSVYSWAVLFNGLPFVVSTIAGQILLRRNLRQLVIRNPRHRTLMRWWMTLYAIVAIQMAYVLRPFVGDPSVPTTFFRAGAWGNAYVVVGEMVWHANEGWRGSPRNPP